jgi:hypothetical protein
MKKKLLEANKIGERFCYPGQEPTGVGYPHTPACRANNYLQLILPKNTSPHPAVRRLVRKIKQTLSN